MSLQSKGFPLSLVVLFQMFFRNKVAKVSLGDMLAIQERLGTKK